MFKRRRNTARSLLGDASESRGVVTTQLVLVTLSIVAIGGLIAIALYRQMAS